LCGYEPEGREFESPGRATFFFFIYLQTSVFLRALFRRGCFS